MSRFLSASAAKDRGRKHYFFGRPYELPLTRISRDARLFTSWTDFNDTCQKYSPYEGYSKTRDAASLYFCGTQDSDSEPKIRLRVRL